jgi:glyoxylase-like metal-dependent hydrolase (beta-lactamase superfamily II)
VTAGIRHPFAAAPAEGEAMAVADGILWLRLPLPMALDHVNVYALRDAEGWTLFDTGLFSRRMVTMWQGLLEGPLAGAPVTRVIVSHHHPDHIGMAGWFQARGAALLTTRTAWLYARMLTLDVQEVPSEEAITFMRRAGMPDAMLSVRMAERPFNFADVVASMPTGFTRVKDGDVLQAAGRDWTVRVGHGHAPEQITLWSGDLILGADQLLPGISANIGVYPTEPYADPLTDWLASCHAFAPLAQDSQLILPGHKLPFSGLPLRLTQMIDNHEQALARLVDLLARPQTAHDTMPTLFKRDLGPAEYGLGIVEAVAHLNCLLQRGLVSRHLAGDGRYLWQAA